MTDLAEFAKTRAQQDSKQLRLAISNLHKLAAPALAGDELLAAHEAFLLNLDALSQQLSKTARLEQVTALEVGSYSAQQREMEATQADTSRKLLLLQDQLAHAQAERVKKIEYDKMAKLIGKLPDRAKGAESLSKLHADVAALEAEKSTYADRWTSRSTEFDAIVAALTKMSNAIKEENREQERRRALDEDDSDSPPAQEQDQPHSSTLDPAAKEFKPSGAGADTPTEGGDEGELEEGEEAEGMSGVEGEQR